MGLSGAHVGQEAERIRLVITLHAPATTRTLIHCRALKPRATPRRWYFFGCSGCPEKEDAPRPNIDALERQTALKRDLGCKNMQAV